VFVIMYDVFLLHELDSSILARLVAFRLYSVQ